jgi:hypothetical protein
MLLSPQDQLQLYCDLTRHKPAEDWPAIWVWSLMARGILRALVEFSRWSDRCFHPTSSLQGMCDIGVADLTSPLLGLFACLWSFGHKVDSCDRPLYFFLDSWHVHSCRCSLYHVVLFQNRVYRETKNIKSQKCPEIEYQGHTSLDK